MGGGEHAGLNYGLLWFEAEAKGSNGRYQAGKSNEVPFSRVAEGIPDSHNPAHISIHSDLVHMLRKDGWEPASGGSSRWWEKRFRRDTSKAPQSLRQKIRSFLSS
ncbi:hypothetical protein [Candidatus Leptofilum sp.]|uniref:hypothetical protein n=1 Tax=Candidatus Leptofilum sp. TaxID=3241576 RepID=UPI003B5965CB